MKIVFISSRYPPDFIGGGEWSTAAIAEGLAALGAEVTVIAGSRKRKEEEINGVKVVRSPELYGLWGKPLLEKRSSESMLSSLKKLLPHDADVVHTHDFRTALLLSRANIPNSFVTVRDFAPICGTTNNMWSDGTSCNGCYWSNVLFRCQRVCEASLARKPFRVWQYKYNLSYRKEAYKNLPNQVYISEALRSTVSSRIELPENTAVIPNPVNNDWLAPVAQYPKEKVVVYAGTVDYYKGIDVLLRAFREVLAAYPDASLIIAGDGKIVEYTKRTEELGISGKVAFPGKMQRSGVISIFDKADVVAQPSLWEEPFGRTAVEGMSRARPVIVSRSGGLKEIVTEDTGYLFERENADDLAEIVKHVFNNAAEASTKGRSGREKVRQTYTPTAVAKKYLEFYQSCILKHKT